jgi:hypothetical protein
MTRRPLALVRQHTAAAAEAPTPGSSPHQLSAATRRACADGPSSRRGPLLKPSEIAVKAVCDRRPAGNGHEGQVHVHAKATLTVIFHRFDPAPVGRMATTGFSLSLPLARPVRRVCFANYHDPYNL